MTIDPTKIRVGDEVTVRTKAFTMFSDGSLTLSNGFIRVYDYIAVENILSHTPAPRPFVVGGKVRNKIDGKSIHVLLSIHERWLWLDYPDNPDTFPMDDWEPCE